MPLFVIFSPSDIPVIGDTAATSVRERERERESGGEREKKKERDGKISEVYKNLF